MDYSMDSVVGDKEAINLQKDLQKILSTAGMHPRKWLSNSKAVLDTIPSADLKQCLQTAEKVLGIFWDHQNDVFLFRVAIHPVEVINTKRVSLRIIA